jgi:hypothetical protein
MAISSADKALCDLFIGAFYFTMHSCEYVRVLGTRKTKIVALWNINFLKGRHSNPHSDVYLRLADCVSITFELQKKDTKNDVITQHRSLDPLLCPVRIWANIVRHLHNLPRASENTTVNSFLLLNNKIHLFTGKELLNCLCLAATSLVTEVLRFTANRIALHSAWSGAAMAMYLAGVPVSTIMLLRCWSSDAFIRYIQKQVKEFSKGVSGKMIQNDFFLPSLILSTRKPNQNQTYSSPSKPLLASRVAFVFRDLSLHW